MSNRSETFGRLLKGAINSIATYEGKTAPIIEEELAEKVGLAGSAIQRYKAGYLPPEPRTIEIIGEAAVRRGFFSREWLQRFLHAARYHQSDKLLEQLCPIGPARPRPPRVYQNLPAPTYSQFVERKEASAEVIEGLNKRSAAVIIVGLGGNGKTSLARETADHCLKSENGTALFDAAVWVSDKDRPGMTNLSIVLDEIARTLDYPGFTQFEHDEKRREVEQLLRRQRVLVCIDNFETITDGALLAWLLNLPEPSKALITTREYRREYRRGGWPIELRGMSDSEARALIDERLKVLRIEKLVNDQPQLERLLTATGGNPKAIEMTLGLAKYVRRSLKQVIDDLDTARGELFDDLFSRAWSLLDEASRRIILGMTFFPASASGIALSTTADVQGFAFERSIERLADLALLDIQLVDLNSIPRYTLHPLVRAYVSAKFREEQSIERTARERWLQWYVGFLDQVNTRWYEVYSLALADPEVENMMEAITWADKNNYLQATILLCETLGYYYYVRGSWSQQLEINILCLAACEKAHNKVGEASTLLNILRVLSLQGRFSEAVGFEARLKGLLAENLQLEQHRMSYLHGFAVLELAKKNVIGGRCLLEEAILLSKGVDTFKYCRARNWLADSYLQEDRLEEAEQLFHASLVDSLLANYTRSITYCQAKLAVIALARSDFAGAEHFLRESYSRAEIVKDRRDLALILKTYAQLYTLRNDLTAARKSLLEAIDLFERLGMRRELAEAREELHRLEDQGEAPAA